MDWVELQRDTFSYFTAQADPRTGLIRDRAREGAPASIAAAGLGLAALCVGAERGFITRGEAVARILAALRFFDEAPQGEAADASGHRGLFYHFLDMETGRRAWRCELSTIDSALLFAGMLAAAQWADGDDPLEAEIRALGTAVPARADWRWAQAGGASISHGWTPERGFLRWRWEGYTEALILYLIALGAPDHSVPAAAYEAMTAGYRWKRLYGQDVLHAGPLFIHQLSHAFVDFRGIRDAAMRARGLDYFENSRRAVLVQQAYAIRNPRGHEGYGPLAWGITAGDGPGPALRPAEGHGRERRFYGYRARGVPSGPDDGTLAPWAVAASLPFAPELVTATLGAIRARWPRLDCVYGLRCSFNPSFPDPQGREGGWIAADHLGLDQGPVVLMIENHLTGLVWQWMRTCPWMRRGLERAGFTGGWLDAAA